MSDQYNEQCIRTHENHKVRLADCEKDINSLGETMRAEVKDIWEGIDKQRKNIGTLFLVILGSVAFQTIAIIISIYIKK